MELFIVPSQSFFSGVIHPAFSALVGGDGVYSGVLSEFTVMDNVPSKRPIIDIRQKMKILQRRDASCDLNYKKIMGTDKRSIEVSDLYGAVKTCKHEFYQGDLRDWQSEDEATFGAMIQPFFQDAMRIDLAANAWFGDTERTDTAALSFSTCEFDGIFKWLATYTTNGLIAAAQTIAAVVADYRSNAGMINAYNLLNAMVAAQPTLLRAIPGMAKAIYVDQAILDGYRKYVRSLGTTSMELVDLYGNGVVMLNAIDGIPIIPVAIWEPILANLNGDNNHHAAILTMRKNFVFATDKEYGEGENMDEALMIWYERKELSWYYQMFLKGGTQIAEPEMVVYAV